MRGLPLHQSIRETFLLIILREQNVDYIRSNALNLIVISKFRALFYYCVNLSEFFLCVAMCRLFLSKRTLLDYLDSKQRKSIITEKTNRDDLLVQLKCVLVSVLCRWYMPLFSLIFLMICCYARIICVANQRVSAQLACASICSQVSFYCII